MIHYRLLTSTFDPATPTAYRSLASARRAARGARAHVYAFASRRSALDLSDSRIHVAASDEAPVLLTRDVLERFVTSSDEARAIHPKYPPSSASSRRRLEARYDWRLAGFDESGRAIEASQHMSVSCKWVRFSAPIYINGRKSTKRGLLAD